MSIYYNNHFDLKLASENITIFQFWMNRERENLFRNLVWPLDCVQLQGVWETGTIVIDIFPTARLSLQKVVAGVVTQRESEKSPLILFKSSACTTLKGQPNLREYVLNLFQFPNLTGSLDGLSVGIHLPSL